MSVNMSRPGQESVINNINSQNTPHCPLLFVHVLGLIIILENEHNASHWTWTPTESRLNGGVFIISIAKWQETKGNRIEPSPCNAGIMVKLLKLSAACVLFCVEGERIRIQRKKGCFCIHLFSPSLRVPAVLALQVCLWRMGKLPHTCRSKNMDKVDRALSGSSCLNPVDPTVHPHSFSALWSVLTLCRCECHSVLAVKPFLKQTVT